MFLSDAASATLRYWRTTQSGFQGPLILALCQTSQDASGVPLPSDANLRGRRPEQPSQPPRGFRAPNYLADNLFLGGARLPQLAFGAPQYVPHHKASGRTRDRKEQHGEPKISAHQEAAESMGSSDDHGPNRCNDNPTADVCSDAGVTATKPETK